MRIYSDDTGKVGLASLRFRPSRGRPAPGLLVGEAQGNLHELSSETNEIYILGLYEAVMNIFQP